MRGGGPECCSRGSTLERDGRPPSFLFVKASLLRATWFRRLKWVRSAEGDQEFFEFLFRVLPAGIAPPHEFDDVQATVAFQRTPDLVLKRAQPPCQGDAAESRFAGHFLKPRLE